LLEFEFHHVGIVTNNIQVETQFYEALGYNKEGNVFEDSVFGIKGIFLTKLNSPRVEIVEKYNGSNVLEPWLKSGSPFYHLAFLVNDYSFNHQIDIGKIVFESEESVAFPNRKIRFVLSSGRKLVEYIYKENAPN
jgi:catechol 2,3-dioxygenase-like lactoylglutathione lyase family enzyme